MTDHNPTFPEASAVVRWYCADFQENMPADMTGQQFMEGIEQLTRKLSYLLERQVRTYDVEGLVERFIEFVELESGDHEDLTPTANGVIDEGGHVRDRLHSQLRDDLYFTVTGAGINATLRAVAA